MKQTYKLAPDDKKMTYKSSNIKVARISKKGIIRTLTKKNA